MRCGKCRVLDIQSVPRKSSATGLDQGSTVGVAWAGSTSSVRLVQVEPGANSGPSPHTQNFCPSAFSLRTPWVWAHHPSPGQVRLDTSQWVSGHV